MLKNDFDVVKINLRGVDFLTKNTAAALDSSLESAMQVVTSVNGLVLFIPGMFFPFSQFSSFPSMLPCQTWLSFLLRGVSGK
jgi:hypothetical protein